MSRGVSERIGSGYVTSVCTGWVNEQEIRFILDVEASICYVRHPLLLDCNFSEAPLLN